MKYTRWTAALLLLALALPLLFADVQPAAAQAVYTPIALDDAHFGVAKVDSLAPGADAYFLLTLKEGDRVVMELQGESDAIQVTQFASPYEPLPFQSPAPFAYSAWSTGDGEYTITVKNTGATAAGFVLRVVASPAPPPTQMVLTEDADGQTIPVTVGEPFQVALDAAEGYTWLVSPYDYGVLKLEAEGATVLLGTMPGAMHQQILTFTTVGAGTATLTLNYAKSLNVSAAGFEGSFNVTIEATERAEAEAAPAEGEGPAVQPLAPDASGKVQATGALEPQGMAAYIITLAEGAQVQAAITAADSGMILTVVGADGMPLQTDHVGASNFDQAMPASQEYIFKVINFGDAAQEYTFDVQVTVADAAAEEPAAEEPAAGEPATEESGDEPAAESAPIVPAPITLAPGNVLVIPLAGNPSTGYVWQVEPSAEGILTPRGDAAFAAPADAPGTPGYEIFTFDVAGAGDVTLTFTHSQPWDETTPPEQVIDLPFTVAAAPAAPAEPPAPPAPVVIGDAENGSAVEVQAGGKLLVNLAGNPTTGYIWQITSKDDSFLKPVDYAFQPASDAEGAGGVEHFEFEAVAAGEVALAFAQSRPWETDADPAATYSVTIKIVEAAQ